MLNHELTFPFTSEGLKLAKMNFLERKVYREKNIDKLDGSKIEKTMVLTLALLMYAEKGIAVTVAAGAKDPLSKVDAVGYRLLGIVHRVGFWICLIEGIIGILEWVLQNNNQGKKKAFSSLLAFMLLYLLPLAFEMVRGMFQ